MAVVKRMGGVVWSGSIARCAGRLKSGSGAIDGLEVTLPTRLAETAALTTPEELLAAAHAACFAISLGACSLDTTPGRRRIVSLEVTARGAVPEVNDDSFADAVREAGRRCLISIACRGRDSHRACDPRARRMSLDGHGAVTLTRRPRFGRAIAAMLI
jgi:osmotically inducible protein OsmC